MAADWRSQMRDAARRQLAAGCSMLLDNAIFLCEQITETSHTPLFEDLLLHATCLEKNGDFLSALAVLEKAGRIQFNASDDARILKATCLYRLGKYVDAKNTLLYDAETDRIRSSADVLAASNESGEVNFVPKRAIGLHLLGLISAKHAEIEDEASLFFECATRLDPFLFQAREQVAIIKGRKDPNISVTIDTKPLTTSETIFGGLETGCYLLASYRCQEALQCFSTLPSEQQKTGFVLSRLGRVNFDKADYPSACQAYDRMRAVDPNRTEGLEYYSTALWHLKREVELAYLARDVAERAPKRPETWCVVGNCFSLEKEHDLALKFFKRALQLDETFTYAYTLAGHEYIANDNFEEAMACYRHALRTDRSHYNAWWGLGTIYAKQEKHDLAELHFRKAINIHPTSSVLWCFLGNVLASQGRLDEALEALDQAKALQPENAQARFLRAKILSTMDEWEDALAEAEYVRDVLPKEAMVHMFIGQVYNRLKQRDKAMMHFVSALDLDPKGAAQVREAINQLDDSSLIDPPSQRAFDVG